MYLTLTPEEHHALAWIADRYDSASVLFDLPDWRDVPAPADIYQRPSRQYVAHITPDTAARYVDALPDDWSTGNRHPLPDTAPPCAGGTLADKCRQVAAYAAHYAGAHQ